MKDNHICKEALETWGGTAQMLVAVEEMVRTAKGNPEKRQPQKGQPDPDY